MRPASPCRARSPFMMTATRSPHRWPKWKGPARGYRRFRCDRSGRQRRARPLPTMPKPWKSKMTIDLAAPPPSVPGLRSRHRGWRLQSVALTIRFGRVVVDRQANAQAIGYHTGTPLSKPNLPPANSNCALLRGPWLRGGVRQRRSRQVLSSLQLRVRRSAPSTKLVAESGTLKGQVPGASPHEVHRTGMIDVCHG